MHYITISCVQLFTHAYGNRLFQTLKSLDLESNEVGSEGARYLANALKHNKVKLPHHSIISYMCLSLVIDTCYAQSSG